MASRSTSTILQLMAILLILLAVGGSSQCPHTNGKKLKPLYILTLLLLPRHTSNRLYFQRARRSYSQIAGVRIAQCEINKWRDLLPGYQLKMIVKNTEGSCVFSPHLLTNNGLDTMVKYTVNPSCPPLIAVNGLSCNLQTSYLSYVAEKHRFDLIQFTAMRLRTISEETEFTRLWRIVDSGAMYVDAVLSLMDKSSFSSSFSSSFLSSSSSVLLELFEERALIMGSR